MPEAELYRGTYLFYIVFFAPKAFIHSNKKHSVVHMQAINEKAFNWIFTSRTFEEPFEYIWIIFSAPCFTFSSISNCFFKAINLLLVEKRGSLFGVSGVLGQSVDYR